MISHCSNNKRVNTIHYFAFIIIGIAFYFLNHYTPIQHDDYAYMYNHKYVDILVPVTNIIEVIQSQYYHYFQTHGRFISHVLIQFFCSLFDKEIFNIINTIILLYGIYLIKEYAQSKLNPSQKTYTYITTFTLLLIGIPDFGLTALWLTGAINYLWTPILSLLLIIIFRKKAIKTNIKYIYYLLYFVLALCISWMQESVTIGLCVSYIIYFILNKNELTGHKIPLFIGVICGTILLIFAPSNFSRANAEGVLAYQSFIPFIANRFLNFIQLISKNYLLLILCLTLFTIYFKKSKTDFLLFIKENIIIIGTIIVNLLFIFCLGKTEIRLLAGINFMIVTLIIKLIVSNFYRIKYNQTIIIVTTIFLCFGIYAYALIECYEYNTFKKRSIVLVNSYPKNSPFPYTRYRKEKASFCYVRNLSANKNAIHNRIMAHYYKRDHIQALPPPLYNRYVQPYFLSNLKKMEYENSNNRAIYKDSIYYIIPLDNKDYFNASITYTSKKGNETTIKLHQKIIRRILGTLTDSTIQRTNALGYFINKSDSCFLIIPAHLEALDIFIELTIDKKETEFLHFHTEES